MENDIVKMALLLSIPMELNIGISMDSCIEKTALLLPKPMELNSGG